MHADMAIYYPEALIALNRAAAPPPHRLWRDE